MRRDANTVDELKNNFIEHALSRYIKADRRVMTFIADFIFIGKTVDDAIAREEIIHNQFRAGYCYYFAHMLKAAFNDGEVCWAAPFGHIVWRYNGEVYDIEGVCDSETDLFIPESFLGDSIKDFKHIRDEVFDATKDDIDRTITEYKQSLAYAQETKILTVRYKRNKRDEFYCQLTDEMNKHLLGLDENSSGIYSTYLQAHGDRKEMDGKPGYIYSIKAPGATRGAYHS